MFWGMGGGGGGGALIRGWALKIILLGVELVLMRGWALNRINTVDLKIIINFP